MFQKVKLFFQLFKAGAALKDKEFWTRQQAYVVPVVVSVLVLCINLAQTFGVEIPSFLDETTLTWLAGAIYMLVNTCITIFSHEHLGIPSKGSTGALSEGSGGETQQALPEASGSPGEGEEPLSSESGNSPRFDSDVYERAKQWRERNTGQVNPYNDFSPN